MNGLHSEDPPYRALGYPVRMPPPLLIQAQSLLPPRPVKNITGWEHRMDCEKREDVQIEVESKGRKKEKEKET